MSKKTVSKKPLFGNRLDQKLMAIPLIVLLIKFVLLFNIPNHAWIGADGENYIGGLEALLKDGYFSKNSLLSYWPAGYPLLMYVFGSVSRSNTLVIMAVLQSILYAVSSLYFVRELAKTHLAKYCFWVAWILAINPTLSLSSMVIGYEIIPASIFLFAMVFFMRDYRLKNNSIISKNSMLAALLFSLSCFVQPRFLLTAAIFFILWAFLTKPKRVIPIFVGVTLIITALLPISLALRNSHANGFKAISTNLGVTMNLGAGSGASGKYEPEGQYGVPCSKIEGDAAQQDSHLVGCVIKWYLTNPTEAAPLLIRKAKYFWAPWFGPEVAGSMNRNPWLQNHPLKSVAINSAEGNNLVYGRSGQLISWTWMAGGLLFLYLGFRRMWNAHGLVRNLGVFSIMIVVTNWMISLGTLGDHRMRVPIMTLSLLLQCVGFLSLFGKKWLIEKDTHKYEKLK
jgi:hypothetical protein